MKGNTDVVRFLCLSGANVNSVDRWNRTPLDEAIYHNYEDCVKILEKYGAKPGESTTELAPLLDLFEKYSKVRDGGRRTLDWHGVQELLQDVGREATDRAVKDLFRTVDKDGDGSIDKDEFLDKSDLFLQGRPARIILIVGGPGSGKGLLSERLVKECGVVHLSSGDLLRQEVQAGTHLGKEVEDIMKSGGLVSSAIMVALMQKRMRDHPGKRILLDGFPRSAENARDLVTLCGKPELALHLNCDDTILIERILARGKSGARADDNIETALKRVRTYHKYHNVTIQFLKTEQVPVVNLDCSATPDGVWEQLSAISRLMRKTLDR
jgi:adenylate kinase family enzyme